jgi:type IV secretion system protein VirB10
MVQNPPPNDPFLNLGAEPDNGEEEELRSGAPVISAAPSKVIMVLGAILAFFVVIGVVVLGGDKKGELQNEKKASIPRDQLQAMPPALPQPEPPAPPAILEPPAPPVAPPISEVPDIAVNEEAEAQRLERLRSEMLVINKGKGLMGGGEEQQATADAQADFASLDPNLGFAARATAASEAPKVKAGFLGDLSVIIAQGKLIHAVLETAVNTTLPGQLRAIVSRDIYAEQTRNILIPKGSRLIGVYNTNIFRGQDRVFIIWTRVIRPDGVDIYVNSPGVDNLGRAGLEGFLDQKFQEVFSGAILTSVIGLGTAGVMDAINGGGNINTNVNTDGSTTASGDALSFATLNAVGNISNVGASVVNGLLDLRPTITIDQGTKVNVMVNRDLYFPPDLASRTVIP